MPQPLEAAWRLDPQLAADTVAAGDLPLCRVLVSRDANYPWLVLVPRRAECVELGDLAAAEQAVLMTEITGAGAALREISGAHKLNVAALGNVVRQLHVHVIARFPEDPAWPRPVWCAASAKAYDDAALALLVGRLRAVLPMA